MTKLERLPEIDLETVQCRSLDFTALVEQTYIVQNKIDQVYAGRPI